MTAIMNFTKTLSGSELDREVRKALAAFVDTNQVFSAYDITQAVRKNVGTSVEVVHDDVRPIVFQLMQGDKFYEVGTKNFNGTVARVFCPSKTTRQVQVSTPTPLGTGSLQVTTTSQPVKKSDDKSLYMYPKSEGRVTVPASVLKTIKAYANDSVYVVEENDKLCITKYAIGASIYTLNNYGSFRLRKAYTSGYKRFKVVTKSDRIELIGER